MITAWRICKSKYAPTAFDGQGAKRNGGRWNSPGVSMVYTAAAASGALLELLVHADATLLSLSYVLIPVEFDDRLVTPLDLAALPAAWQEDQTVTRALGDEWAKASTSLVLGAPSAILDVERNYLINPLHPDSSQLKIGAPRPLIVEDRLKALLSGR